MSNKEVYEIIYRGNVGVYETHMLHQAEQEIRAGKPGHWCRVADTYVRQLAILEISPFPEDCDEKNHINDMISHIHQWIHYDNFYRWKVPRGRTGNHRIIYAIHNYSKVVFLHYFKKPYNGAIRLSDIKPAEDEYMEYCFMDPSLYE